MCFSHLRWDFVYQRPQHLLSRAAQSYRVFFVEEPVFLPGICPRLEITDTQEQTVVIAPCLPEDLGPHRTSQLIQGLLHDFIRKSAIRPKVLWYYTPMAIAYSRGLEASVIVYDNMDELSAFRGAPPQLLALEEELLGLADLVFTGGMSLYGAKRGRHPSVHPFPSSIDAAHFQKARNTRIEPRDQLIIPRPRIGFFGVIDERMNADLVRAIAELKPDWQFVIIGPVVKIEAGTLPQQPNVHWLGPKTYSELPSYLAGWSAGFMPFALNEATEFISPTKTPEFLAAGVPVVSTSITDVVSPYGERGLVQIANAPADFVAKLEAVLACRRDSWLIEVDRHLASMSWDKTWAAMHSLIIAAGTAKAARSRPTHRRASRPDAPFDTEVVSV
jgi:glycosyltransferase involved in cell wall biosynthesis